MANVPTISITNPDLESEDLMLRSAPGSPTVMAVNDNTDVEPTTPDNGQAETTNDLDHATMADSQDPDTPEPHALPSDSMPLHIREFYRKKYILITGATGFIGKALLWKLLHSLHEEIEGIFLLVRPRQRSRSEVHHHSPRTASHHSRLQDEILSNKAFVSLKRTMGASLFDKVVAKVRVVNGDVTLPSLGLCKEDRIDLLEHTNVIFHCAGSMDGNDYLDAAIQTNVLGTLNLINVANECRSLASLVHLSPLPARRSPTFEDRLCPMPSDVFEHYTLSFKDSPAILEDIQHKFKYPNAFFFSKSLAEHLLVKEADKKRGLWQFPVAICRLSPVGPSVTEPLVGWADDVNGANGILFLTGQGTRIHQPDHGDHFADVVPVDFAVRMIVGCAATMTLPGSDFRLPVSDLHVDSTTSVESPTDERQSLVESIRDSATSEGVSTYRSSAGSHASTNTSVHTEVSPATCFPYIYHIKAPRPIQWRLAYESIRQFWNSTSTVTLPPVHMYFTANAKGIPSQSGTRSVLSSVRLAMNSYIGGNETNMPTSMSHNHHVKRSSESRKMFEKKALRIAPILKSSLFTNAFTITDANALRLQHTLQGDYHAAEFDPMKLFQKSTSQSHPDSTAPLSPGTEFWVMYFLNASYGIYHFVINDAALRLPMPTQGWRCALHRDGHEQWQQQEKKPREEHVIDRPVRSAQFSPDEIQDRTQRMISEFRRVLVHRESSAMQTLDMSESWLEDLDDSLEDWCQDESTSDRDKRMMLGKWHRKMGSNDKATKVVVLNDKRVNQAIEQITQNAGVPKETAAEEAMKILARMSERTQLAYVWFAGSFLKTLFGNMFDTILVQPESIRAIRAVMSDRRVVYVPTSKSILDYLLVWYIAIRYHLPVPALVCDEVLAKLGPISDIYRLAGAYYVKRDPSLRSPLNTAVTAAYTQVLLREHGALAMSLERSRSRSGKYQEPYHDGLVEMIIESTLQSNQAPSVRSSAIERTVSLDSTPPDSPESITSPTLSIHGSTLMTPAAHRDVVIVPINISYEDIPELSSLVDEVLDQHSHKTQKSTPPVSPRTQRIQRPSETAGRRHGTGGPHKYGRVLFGIGETISVQQAAAEHDDQPGGELSASHEQVLVQKVIRQTHENQRKALIVSPLSLVSAIILYGRATGGVCFGKIKEMMEWLLSECVHRGYRVDWEEREDLDDIAYYVRRFKESKDIVSYGKEIHDDTNIRINDHADSVMTLSHYANQIVDIFLLDACFAVVYLSFSEDRVHADDFQDRFVFLAQMLEREFALSWDINEQFKTVVDQFERRKMVRRVKASDGSSQLVLGVKMETRHIPYEQLMFLASLVYPVIDSYWITSCSLSVLEVVPMLPLSIVPVLAQWIAAHMITNRRTIYREVLSAESSKIAVHVFISLGFLAKVEAKRNLQPNAQILLHELGIPTAETLITLSAQTDDEPSSSDSPVDPEVMMKALLAKIEMNRANSNMADLFAQIETYRGGEASKREAFQSAQVFRKCQKQIKDIARADITFAKKRQVELKDHEEKLVQLVYALRANSSPSQDNNPRRISEAYNLR